MTGYTRDWVRSQLLQRIDIFKIFNIPRHNLPKKKAPDGVQAYLGCHPGEDWIDDIYEWLQHILDMLARLDLKDRGRWEWRLADTLLTIAELQRIEEENRKAAEEEDRKAAEEESTEKTNVIETDPVEINPVETEPTWDTIYQEAISNGAAPLPVIGNDTRSGERDITWEEMDDDAYFASLFSDEYYGNQTYESDYEYDEFERKAEMFVENKRNERNKNQERRKWIKTGTKGGEVTRAKQHFNQNMIGDATGQFTEDFDHLLEDAVDQVMEQATTETDREGMEHLLDAEAAQLATNLETTRGHINEIVRVARIEDVIEQRRREDEEFNEGDGDVFVYAGTDNGDRMRNTGNGNPPRGWGQAGGGGGDEGGGGDGGGDGGEPGDEGNDYVFEDDNEINTTNEDAIRIMRQLRDRGELEDDVDFEREARRMRFTQMLMRALRPADEWDAEYYRVTTDTTYTVENARTREVNEERRERDREREIENILRPHTIRHPVHVNYDQLLLEELCLDRILHNMARDQRPQQNADQNRPENKNDYKKVIKKLSILTKKEWERINAQRKFREYRNKNRNRDRSLSPSPPPDHADPEYEVIKTFLANLALARECRNANVGYASKINDTEFVESLLNEDNQIKAGAVREEPTPPNMPDENDEAHREAVQSNIDVPFTVQTFDKMLQLRIDIEFKYKKRLIARGKLLNGLYDSMRNYTLSDNIQFETAQYAMDAVTLILDKVQEVDVNFHATHPSIGEAMNRRREIREETIAGMARRLEEVRNGKHFQRPIILKIFTGISKINVIEDDITTKLLKNIDEVNQWLHIVSYDHDHGDWVLYNTDPGFKQEKDRFIAYKFHLIHVCDRTLKRIALMRRLLVENYRCSASYSNDLIYMWQKSGNISELKFDMHSIGQYYNLFFEDMKDRLLDPTRTLEAKIEMMKRLWHIQDRYISPEILETRTKLLTNILNMPLERQSDEFDRLIVKIHNNIVNRQYWFLKQIVIDDHTISDIGMERLKQYDTQLQAMFRSVKRLQREISIEAPPDAYEAATTQQIDMQRTEHLQRLDVQTTVIRELKETHKQLSDNNKHFKDIMEQPVMKWIEYLSLWKENLEIAEIQIDDVIRIRTKMDALMRVEIQQLFEDEDGLVDRENTIVTEIHHELTVTAWRQIVAEFKETIQDLLDKNDLIPKIIDKLISDEEYLYEELLITEEIIFEIMDKQPLEYIQGVRDRIKIRIELRERLKALLFRFQETVDEYIEEKNIFLTDVMSIPAVYKQMTDRVEAETILNEIELIKIQADNIDMYREEMERISNDGTLSSTQRKNLKRRLGKQKIESEKKLNEDMNQKIIQRLIDLSHEQWLLLSTLFDAHYRLSLQRFNEYRTYMDDINTHLRDIARTTGEHFREDGVNQPNVVVSMYYRKRLQLKIKREQDEMLEYRDRHPYWIYDTKTKPYDRDLTNSEKERLKLVENKIKHEITFVKPDEKKAVEMEMVRSLIHNLLRDLNTRKSRDIIRGINRETSLLWVYDSYRIPYNRKLKYTEYLKIKEIIDEKNANGTVSVEKENVLDIERSRLLLNKIINRQSRSILTWWDEKHTQSDHKNFAFHERKDVDKPPENERPDMRPERRPFVYLPRVLPRFIYWDGDAGHNVPEPHQDIPEPLHEVPEIHHQTHHQARHDIPETRHEVPEIHHQAHHDITETHHETRDIHNVPETDHNVPEPNHDITETHHQAHHDITETRHEVPESHHQGHHDITETHHENDPEELWHDDYENHRNRFFDEYEGNQDGKYEQRRDKETRYEEPTPESWKTRYEEPTPEDWETRYEEPTPENWETPHEVHADNHTQVETYSDEGKKDDDYNDNQYYVNENKRNRQEAFERRANYYKDPESDEDQEYETRNEIVPVDTGYEDYNDTVDTSRDYNVPEQYIPETEETRYDVPGGYDAPPDDEKKERK